MVLQRLPTSSSGDDAVPPPRPEHYDERYELPAHRTYPLARINWHPMDDRLVFYEDPHVYTLDGRPVSESMTGLAHACQQPFDGHAAIRMMKMSKAQCWPRLKYALGARFCANPELEATPDRGVLLVRGEQSLVATRPYDFGAISGVALVDAVRGMCSAAVGDKRGHDDEMGYDDGIEVHTFERAMTDAEILASWEANGLDARNRGTEAHLQMQLAVEGCAFRPDDAEVVHGLRAFGRIDDAWRAYRAEWEIAYPDADIAGSIDLVVAAGGADEAVALGLETAPPLRVIIVDYKRSKDLPGRMRSGRKQRAPLSHLDDCDGATYALQLSGYQYVLERVYGLTVVDRVLMSIHPDRPWCTSVPYLGEEIEHLMEARRARAAARASCPLRCPLSGVTLHDPVTVAERPELVVDRKHALVQGWTVEGAHDETARAVASHVEAVLPAPGTPPTFSKTWKARMPPSGYLRPAFFSESDDGGGAGGGDDGA